MDFKTLNDVATWMISNIRLSRYDDQFVSNLSMYILQHGRITTNQDALFKKVVGKYNRQFMHHKFDVEKILSLPWPVSIVESIPEYTGASIKIENNQIIFRSPYNKNFLTALRKNPIYSLQWIKDKRQFEASYSPSVLKKLMYLSADHYEILNYCPIVTQIIDSLSAYEDIKYWVPTLVYKNGHYYIAALNNHLYQAIKHIELVDDLVTVANLVKYGVAVDQSVKDHLLKTNDAKKVKFAISFQAEIEIRDVNLAIEWLHELGCDAISEPRSFMTKNAIDFSDSIITVCKNPKELSNYSNPAIVYMKGTFSLISDRPLQLFKIIKFVNSDPVYLGPK